MTLETIGTRGTKTEAAIGIVVVIRARKGKVEIGITTTTTTIGKGGASDSKTIMMISRGSREEGEISMNGTNSKEETIGETIGVVTMVETETGEAEGGEGEEAEDTDEEGQEIMAVQKVTKTRTIPGSKTMTCRYKRETRPLRRAVRLRITSPKSIDVESQLRLAP